jgi:hypothetical protein
MSSCYEARGNETLDIYMEACEEQPDDDHEDITQEKGQPK